MWCVGSNQARCRGSPVAPSATGRKRSCVFILCISRRTDCAICWACCMSASSGCTAQRGFVHQPPQQAVQQGEALRVLVQHHDLAQAQEGRRHDGGGGPRQVASTPVGVRRQRLGVQVVGQRVHRFPAHLLGRHLVGQQLARLEAKARQIDFTGQQRHGHARAPLAGAQSSMGRRLALARLMWVTSWCRGRPMWARRLSRRPRASITRYSSAAITSGPM